MATRSRLKEQPQDFQALKDAPTALDRGLQMMIDILGGGNDWVPPFVEYERDPVGFIRSALGVRHLTKEQVEICESVRDNRVTNVQASHGIGKCVAQNDKILLANGLEVPAKSLVGEKFKLLTLVDGKVTPVDAKAEWNQTEAVYEIVTETGKRIVRNAHHPLFAAIKWTKEGAHPILDEKGWTSIEAMKEWQSNPPEYLKSKFTAEDWSVEKSYKAEVVCAMPKEIPVFGDQSMPEHEIKLLAYLIGDGGLTSGTPVFTQKEGPQLNEVKECVEKMGCVLKYRSQYDYGIVNPIGSRHTHSKPTSLALGEEKDFSCDDHISLSKLKRDMGHSDNTLYLRLPLLKISPLRFFGKSYISKSQFNLYQKYDECLLESKLLKRIGSTRGNSSSALELLTQHEGIFNIEHPKIERLEEQKQLAILAVKKRNGIEPGTRKNGQKLNPVANLLRQHDVMGKGSAEKVIPDCVFKLPKHQMALFLSRLFATDGWACVDCNGIADIGFCSASQEMVEQIQRLLLRFGITAKVSKKSKVNAWSLYIRTSQMQIKFASEIGIFGKENALEKVIAVANKKQTSKQVPKWRENKAPIGTAWEKVKSIRKLEEVDRTVAIEVPKHHTYLTSFYEHNTYISACLVLWWLFAVGGVVVTTAPTEQQVKNLLWKEIRRLHAAHAAILGGNCDTLQLRVNEQAFAYGFTAKDYSKDSFQGVHEKKLLLIQDEANGISEDINDGFDSCITGSHNRGLKIGNPVTPSTPFHFSCSKSHIRIPVWSHPNVEWAYELHPDGIHRLKPEIAEKIVSYDEKGNVSILAQEHWPPELPRDIIDGAASISWIEEIARPKGESSSYWIARVEGKFPIDSAFSIIPTSLFMAARARYDLDSEYWDALAAAHPSRLGVDPGDSEDPHGFGRWQGPVFYMTDEQPTQGDQHDQERCAARAVRILEECPGEAHVDRIGVGAAVPGMIENDGFAAYGIAWSESDMLDDPAQFMNRKVEDMWTLREALRTGEAVIAPLGKYEDKLSEECAGTYYEEMPSGKYKIELKTKTRKRLKRSPNLLDAMVLGHTNKTSVVAMVERAMSTLS